MSSNNSKMLFVLTAAIVLVSGLLFFRPSYFTNASSLASLSGGVVLLGAACNYRRAFLPLILICFLFAGSAVPFRSELLAGRWVLLAVGSVLGVAVYLRAHHHQFKTIHLVAGFCALSAFVSACVSTYPSESLLKAASLFLLLLYACAGARTAAAANPEAFFRASLRGAEVLALATACAYLVFRWEVFGNPNSLGAVTAILIIPLLFWGYLSAQARMERLRLGFELILAVILLFSSFSRASIATAVISCFLVCWAAKEFRMMIKGTALAVILAIAVVIFVPRHSDAPSWDGTESITSLFLFKGKHGGDVLQSRRAPWRKTWQVIREKPWFGSGFGTSEVSEDMTRLEYAEHHIDSWVVREHGNSYLAVVEWTGLLGVVPFVALIILVGTNASKTLLFLRRSRDLSCPAIPAAAVAISGLIHAGFEDWLFAVGYYACIFFWCMVFILNDVMPTPIATYSPARAVPDASTHYGLMAPVR